MLKTFILYYLRVNIVKRLSKYSCVFLFSPFLGHLQFVRQKPFTLITAMKQSVKGLKET